MCYSPRQFATSAKSVKNKPVVNEVISGETMIKRMKKEINELKKQLEKVSEVTGASYFPNTFFRMIKVYLVSCRGYILFCFQFAVFVHILENTVIW